jgi:hypothetical protein
VTLKQLAVLNPVLLHTQIDKLRSIDPTFVAAKTSKDFKGFVDEKDPKQRKIEAIMNAY